MSLVAPEIMIQETRCRSVKCILQVNVQNRSALRACHLAAYAPEFADPSETVLFFADHPSRKEALPRANGSGSARFGDRSAVQQVFDPDREAPHPHARGMPDR